MHPIWLIVLERCFASAGRRAKGLTRAFEVRTAIGISTLGSRYRFPAGTNAHRALLSSYR